MQRCCHWTFFLLWALMTLPSSPARAQPLQDDNYSIDLHRGPVMGSTRIIGLGGAYSAVAEGTEGIPFNPASVVNRAYFSRDKLDWSYVFDFLLPNGSGEGFDFDNNGRSSSKGAWPELVLGAHLQYGIWGIGVYGAFSLLKFESGGKSYTANLVNVHLSTGLAFWDHQLLVAVGFHGGSFALSLEGDTNDLFRTGATALEAGVLYRPRALPLRLGAALTLPFANDTDLQCNQGCPQDVYLPQRATLPWEVRVGAAYYFGGRPFNPWPDFRGVSSGRSSSLLAGAGSAPATRSGSSAPSSAPASLATSGPTSTPATPASTPASTPTSRATSRPFDADTDYGGGRYVMVSAEVVIVGTSASDAVGPDGFLDQLQEPVGQMVVISPRLGVESEVWRRRLRLRAGTYYEPSRYEGVSGRLHGTASMLLRLFDFSLWGRRSLSFAPGVDLAARYFNVSVFLSFWH
ncbi:MAG: hypothetical protein JRH20_04410 [Deltaproteobacteria bacterium]|nr:hypothetical protein [Deltaproteobacteria bacterium]